MTQAIDVPPGFERHERPSPVTDPWQPIYIKHSQSKVVLGIRAQRQHCNSRGFVHGGLISAFADNAMGLTCRLSHTDAPQGLVTSTLNLEFLAAIEQGQWVEFETTSVKVGRRLDAAQGQVLADGKVCAFCSATFSVL